MLGFRGRHITSQGTGAQAAEFKFCARRATKCTRHSLGWMDPIGVASWEPKPFTQSMVAKKMKLLSTKKGACEGQ